MFQISVSSSIRLELLDLPHAPALFELTCSNQAFLSRWLPWVGFIQRIEDTEKFIQATKQQWASGNGFQCAIFYQERLAGIIGFHEFNRSNDSASVGYWLGEQYQAMGLIQQSLPILIEQAFYIYAIQRVVIRCAVHNQASRKIPEKLGFQLEGILKANEKLHGQYIDQAIYSLIKS